MQRTVSFDTETFYSANFSVVNLGAHKYAWDPRCDCYLISVHDGADSWAGHPRDFNFDSLEGNVLLSHNSAFDQEVYFANVAHGLWPKISFKEWHCTANMSSYLCNRRSLAEASEFLLEKRVAKGMRDYMKGKTWDDAVREGKSEELLQYARTDAELCHELFAKHGHRWPEWERRLSALTIEQGRRGVHLHQERLEAGILLLQRVILEATDKLPWVETGRAPASPHGVAEACRASGIPCPPVKAHNADAAAEWEEQYAGTQPWIKALKDLRKAKKTLATLETMKERLREDGTIGFSLKYFGAHTGRWSGDAGINFQNFNRLPLFVDASWQFIDDLEVLAQLAKQFEKTPDNMPVPCIDVRGLLLPPPGFKVGSVDLSQIEPRVLNTIVGNHELLAKIKAGFPLYESHARDSMKWAGGELKKEAPKKYSLAKARVLGLGYGCGWEKFITVARTMAQLDITEDDEQVARENSVDGQIYHTDEKGVPCAAYVKTWGRTIYHTNSEPTRDIEHAPVRGFNSRMIVKDFRDNNPLITDLWKRMQGELEEAANNQEDLEIELPSGRKLCYRRVRWEYRNGKDKEGNPVKKKVIVAEADGFRKVYYGGLLVENIVQAIARDVFALGMLRTVDAGIWTMWSVHDEAVNAVRDEAEGELARTLMATVPEWLPECPIAAELVMSDRYKK